MVMRDENGPGQAGPKLTQTEMGGLSTSPNMKWTSTGPPKYCTFQFEPAHRLSGQPIPYYRGKKAVNIANINKEQVKKIRDDLQRNKAYHPFTFILYI